MPSAIWNYFEKARWIKIKITAWIKLGFLSPQIKIFEKWLSDVSRKKLKEDAGRAGLRYSWQNEERDLFAVGASWYCLAGWTSKKRRAKEKARRYSVFEGSALLVRQEVWLNTFFIVILTHVLSVSLTHKHAQNTLS